MSADEPKGIVVEPGQPSGRDPETAAVLGAAFEVHTVLGQWFLEAVYLNALCLELTLRQVPHRREVAIPVFYKDVKLPCGYRTDVLAYVDLIVELKAQSALTEVDRAQVINYLKATGPERAQLLNFGTPRLQYQRIVLSRNFRERGPKMEACDEKDEP